MNATLDTIKREALAERTRVKELLALIAEYVQWQIDFDAIDTCDTPEDMTAHVNGLVYRWANEAMDVLDYGLSGTRARRQRRAEKTPEQRARLEEAGHE